MIRQLKLAFFSVSAFYLIQPGFLIAGTMKDWAYGGINLGTAYSEASHKTKSNCATTPGGGVFCSSGFEANGVAVESTGKGKLPTTSILGGIQVGHNWQIENMIYGAEADINIINLHKSKNKAGIFPVAFLGNSYSLFQSVSTDWFGTLRGRLAYIVKESPYTLYGTAGFALTNYRVSFQYKDNAIGVGIPGGLGRNQKSHLKLGLAVGGGLEWLNSKASSIKVEYMFMKFDSINLGIDTLNTPVFYQNMNVKYNLDAHMLRVGYNYKLDSLMQYLGKSFN